MFSRISKFLLQVWESLRFAAQALRSNLMRTTLSLSGVTIGIFAIVVVFAVIDSLERTIRKDMSFIGEDVMYIQKFPWGFGRGPGEYPWWKYLARPANTVQEYEFLSKNIEQAQAVAILAGKNGSTVKYKNSSFSSANLSGVSYDYSKIQELEIDQGRYFTPREARAGSNVAIIGAEIAETLFYNQTAIGKGMKIRNRRFTIIGVMKKEGLNLFGFSARDTQVILPYKAMGKLYRLGEDGIEPTIALKGYPQDEGLRTLEGEVTGLMRARRSLKPREDNDFALNRTESFSDAITSLFDFIGWAGWFIGIFSILVGGFGIANIMFVSVKERTSIIGIQKSLGAKNYFILFQFLFEAIFLSLIGGLVGIGLVFLITLIPLGGFQLALSFSNIMLGITVASVVGIASGVLPAFIASRLNPVEAIRAN